MARAKAVSTGGHKWRQATGQVSVATSLTRQEAKDFRAIAAKLGLSAAEFSRRLCRYAVAAAEDEKFLEKFAEKG